MRNSLGHDPKVKLLAAIILCVGCAVTTRSDPPPSLHLTQISSREFVDLSKISFIRLPVTTPDDPSCSPYCQTRWGADMIVDGVGVSYSEEAERELRRMLSTIGTSASGDVYELLRVGGTITCGGPGDGCRATAPIR